MLADSEGNKDNINIENKNLHQDTKAKSPSTVQASQGI